MKKLLLFLAITTLVCACGGKDYYLAPTFKTRATAHKTVAVLPYDVITNGKVPEGMTETRKKEIEEEETKAFQQSLYNGLVSNLGRSPIQIQAPNKTNNILRTKGINMRDVAKSNPEDLAKILGVDAVVFATVTKYRYMDDKAAMGIGLGKSVLSSVTRGQSNLYTSGVSSKTNDVKVTCSLIDAKTGEVLWKINSDTEVDWNKTSNVVIDRVNGRLSESFPYKFLKN